MARNIDYQRQSISGLLQTYGERAKQAALEGLLEGGEIVAAEAKRNCPVDTGRLRDSIHTEKKGNKVRVVADAKNPKDGYYYGKLIEYSPKGKPFLHSALDAKRAEVKQKVLEKIRAAINQR